MLNPTTPAAVQVPLRRVDASSVRGLLTPLVVVAVAGAPLLIPRGPGNTVPVDAANLILILFAGVTLTRRNANIRLPLGISYLLILIGGVLATTQSIAPRASGLAIVQDLYLYILFVAVVNAIVRDGSERLARIMAVSWTVAALVVAGLVIFAALAYPESYPTLFNWRMVNIYGRALGPLRDPNMAGTYLVMSLFVLWASPWPKKRLPKLIWSVPLAVAIYETQSITALAALAGGGLVALGLAMFARRDAAVALLLSVIAAGAVALTLVPRDFSGTPDLAGSLGQTAIFSESLGRTNTSLNIRVQRWGDALEFFGDQTLLGIGPATTDRALRARGAPITGEIHNDYIAGFLERGVLGGAGVLMLFVVSAIRGLQIGNERRFILSGWKPAALTGGVVAVLMSAISLETLHFRHIWLYMALIFGLALLKQGPARFDTQ